MVRLFLSRRTKRFRTGNGVRRTHVHVVLDYWQRADHQLRSRTGKHDQGSPRGRHIVQVQGRNTPGYRDRYVSGVSNRFLMIIIDRCTDIIIMV